ncbi:MAG TPA: NAD(P)/FAD-dependent oxidoreductase [Chryseolinea sp.]|nr:NAD(P)/FAD-dependent oxidoreductase [Chryseolinea sp.]
MKKNKHIAVVGGGLVGSMLSVYLAKRGYRVSVFERRSDMRKHSGDAGRSINLALSNRGIKSLEEIGLAEQLKQASVPMRGRMMHDVNGKLTFQPYGKEGQFINSVSRSELNKVLMTQAEKNGVTFFFDHRCVGVDLKETTLSLLSDGRTIHEQFDNIIGADGAFSSVRGTMQITERFDYSQDYIDHGYKEFTIPAGTGGEFLMEKNALHIWPRESYMLIALPNPDGSFTCTLFFPFEGTPSFNSLSNPNDFFGFFKETFPDAIPLMPSLLQELKENPTSSLLTIRCYPWTIQNTLLIGDAAHGIVPFYGQGMNAGFEDCRILNNLLNEFGDDWDTIVPAFQQSRKPDTDAIATLALANFIEMRDLVADADFLLRKKIEAKLHELFPDRWIPLYSMVTFHENIRYSDALKTGLKQQQIMDKVMKTPGIETTWQALDFQQLVRQIEEA